jgi:hypothetical protein
MKIKRTMPQWVWWKKGECVVEILTAGHFPTSVIAKLPNDKETEIDIDELEVTNER